MSNSPDQYTAKDVNAFAASFLRLKAFLPKSYRMFIERAIRGLRKDLPIEGDKK